MGQKIDEIERTYSFEWPHRMNLCTTEGLLQLSTLKHKESRRKKEHLLVIDKEDLVANDKNIQPVRRFSRYKL